MGRATRVDVWRVMCLLTVLLPTASVMQTRAGDATVPELQSLVSKWVDLRSQTAAEKRDWKEKRFQWTREIALLEAEKATLVEELAETDEQLTSVEEKRVRLLEKKEQLEQSLTGLAPLLDRAEADLRPWALCVPLALRADLQKLLAQLPTTQEQARAALVTHRLQVVIALYTQIEILQHTVHVTRELLPVGNGVRRELDVLYLGLARGFAVSPDDLWAAVGTPRPDGWTWTPRPALAAGIREAISVFNRQSPAELVLLPVGVVTPDTGVSP